MVKIFYSKKYIKEILIKFDSFVCVILISLNFFLIALSVILRYLFNISLFWVPELSSYLYLWFVFLGAILVTEKRSHLKMDFFRERLPYNIKILIEFIFNLLIICFLVIILIGSVKLIQVNYPLRSPVLKIPEVIALFCVQINAFFILLIYFFRFNRSLICIYEKIKKSKS